MKSEDRSDFKTVPSGQKVKIAVTGEKSVELNVGAAVLLLIAVGNCKHLAFCWTEHRTKRRERSLKQKGKKRKEKKRERESVCV
jgi:hypothetical protein